MEDPRTADGVEHLQAAARELILAARSFLEVAEEVVEDRDRFAGAAATVVDLLRDGLGGVRAPGSPLEPWEEAAWEASPPFEPDASAEDGRASAEDEDPAPPENPPASRPARSAPRSTPSRVRRIAVD